MIMRRGSSLLATVGTLVLGVGALGAAGYTMLSGDCGGCTAGTCSSETTAAVVAVANTGDEPASCCALGAMAQEAEVVEASNTEKSECAKSCCGSAKVVEAANVEKAECASTCATACSGAKTIEASAEKTCASACGSSCGDKAQTIAASNTQKTCASACGSSCGDKGSSFNAPTVFAASYPIMMPSMNFSAKASCCGGCDKGAAVQNVANTVEKSCGSACGSSCGDKAQAIAASNTEKTCASACGSTCSGKAETVQAVANTVEKTCASACGSSCGDKAATQTIAAATTKTCASACGSSCGEKSAKTSMAMINWTVKPGIIRPASLIQPMTKAGSCSKGCCSSGAAVQPVATEKADSGCCAGSGERADGKPCCGQCTDKKDEASEPVAAAG